MKICPVCGKPYEDDVLECGLCGYQFPDKAPSPEANSATDSISGGTASNVGMGDANAINGDVHLSDDHSEQNSNNTSDSNNATNSYNTTTSTTNNTTIYEASKSESEKLKENILTYRLKCKELFNDGIITSEGERQLRELQFNLNLADELVTPIKEEVRQLSKSRKKVISLDGKVVIRQTKSIFEQNTKDALQRQLTRLETLMQEYDDSSLKLVYFQLSAMLESGRYTVRYEDSAHDEYWEAYWAYVAYMIQNREEQACEALASLGRWHALYPEQNDLILRVVGQIMCDEPLDSIQYTRSLLPANYTPELQLIVDTIDELLTADWESEYVHLRPAHSFFINTLFTNFVNTQKELGMKRLADKKALKEAKTKEEEQKKHAEELAQQAAARAKAEAAAQEARLEAERQKAENLAKSQNLAREQREAQEAARAAAKAEAERIEQERKAAKEENKRIRETARRNWLTKNLWPVLGVVTLIIIAVVLCIWIPKHNAAKAHQENQRNLELKNYELLISTCRKNISQSTTDNLAPLDSAAHQLARIKHDYKRLEQDQTVVQELDNQFDKKANDLKWRFERMTKGALVPERSLQYNKNRAFIDQLMELKE